MGQLGLATVVVGVEVEIRVQVVHVQVGAGGVEGFAAARRARTGAARQQVGVGQRRLGHARHLCAPSRIGWSVTDVPLMAAKGKRKRNDEPKRSLRRRGGRGRPTSWSAWTAARRRRRWPAARRPATADRPRGRPAPRSAPADWLPASTCRRRRTFSVGGPTRSTDRAVSRTHCTNARRTFSFRNPPINLSQSETDSECAKTQ